ncbi:DEAD/DEAH box helicase [Acidihalobacter ferrooxydans]|uniref:ATP-dependent DNA helicase RecG n=1 Tax=Acidihalobacter ferrooxydans TaxID=1765967 RepID=A0A1P8UFA3_9GAMM|nr:DEAD/DEAH box helicase [Acidihalobacter ferrooxydans]APZ42533.1 hypothetical protein BW247_05025 [Acidihalobacter ferrooxydans]
MATVAATPTQDAREAVGLLSLFGLTQRWQIPMLLPRRFEDLRNPVTQFTSVDGLDASAQLVVGRLARPPDRLSNPPRMDVVLCDVNGFTLKFTLYGDRASLDEFENTLVSRRSEVAVFGEPRWYGKTLILRSAALVDADWVGRVRPVYPGTRRCSPETTRRRVLSDLQTLAPITAAWMAQHLVPAVGSMDAVKHIAGIPPNVTLSRVIERAHLPLAPEQGVAAQRMLERIGALWQFICALDSHRTVQAVPRWRAPADWRRRAPALGFHLTDEQIRAVDETVEDLRADVAMRRMLIGDVGTGKTAVYALVAAACVDGGARVAVLLPNERLAEQVHANMARWWPDLSPLRLTGETDASVDIASQRWVVGTTAILHRKSGAFDVVIIDEQHKFSREQRDALCSAGTHQLEVTATCIPRSQALINFGMARVSRLRQAHVNKRLHTRLWNPGEQSGLFAAIQQTCRRGDQVIVIYPRKSLSEDSDAKEAAEAAFVHWDRIFPGRVVLAHGDQDTRSNAEAMDRMAKGAASVLIATTVVEVGIDLPGVRRVVVVQPDRLGLVQLHQLRGRAARTGGEGWFDLYLQHKVSPKTRERLSVLLTVSDGFEVAEQDMRLRGFGSLSAHSNRQSGADGMLLFGHSISVELAEEVAAKLSEMAPEKAN